MNQLADIIGGVTKGRDLADRSTVEVPYLRVANVQRGFLDLEVMKTIEVPADEVERYLLHAGDVVLTEGGDADKLGRAALWQGQIQPCIHQNHIFRARLIDHLMSSQWLVYYANSEQGRAYFAEAAKQTVNLASINLNQLRNCPVPLAPLSEQQRIVAAIEQQFTRLDAGVAVLKSAQARLKRYRAAVLKAAVEGNLTEAWRAEHIDTEPASVLLQRILAERRARWEADLRAKGKDPAKGRYEEPAAPDTTELPELPEGWCWARFEQASQRVTVGHVGPMKDGYIDEGIPFLRSQNVRPNRFDPEGLKFISRSFHQQLSKSALEPGDLLIVRSGSVGIACVMPDTYAEANCSDLVIVKQPIHLNPHYAAYYMNSTAQDRVRAQQVGIALTHFNTQSMAAMPLPLPPLDEQEQIVTEVERRLSVVDGLEVTVEANLKRAERLRQSILREAFAGRLVPQDPNDEPASVLLERIQQEREDSAANNNRASLPSKNGKRSERQETSAQAIALDFVLDQEIGQLHSVAQQISLWEKDSGKDE